MLQLCSEISDQTNNHSNTIRTLALMEVQVIQDKVKTSHEQFKERTVEAAAQRFVDIFEK
jgi:hypothetical protein